MASTPGYIVQPDDELRISVSGKRPAGAPRINAKYVVDPEGFVDITPYCRVEVAGMSIPDAQSAVEQSLRTRMELPLAVIEVTAKNRRCYYVVVKAAASGMDNVAKSKLPPAERELDVIEKWVLIIWPTTWQIWTGACVGNGGGREIVCQSPQVRPTSTEGESRNAS